MGDITQFTFETDVGTAFSGTNNWTLRTEDYDNNVYTLDIGPDLTDPTSYVEEKAGPVAVTLRTHGRLEPTTTGGTEVPFMFAVHAFWTFRAGSSAVQLTLNMHTLTSDPSGIFSDDPVNYSGVDIPGAQVRWSNNTTPGTCYFRDLDLLTPSFTTWQAGARNWPDPLDGGWANDSGRGRWRLAEQESESVFIDITDPYVQSRLQSQSLTGTGPYTLTLNGIAIAYDQSLGNGEPEANFYGPVVPGLQFEASTASGSFIGTITAASVTKNSNGNFQWGFTGSPFGFLATPTQTQITFTVASGTAPTAGQELLTFKARSTDPLFELAQQHQHEYRLVVYSDASSSAEAESIAAQEGWGTAVDGTIPGGLRPYCWQNPATANYLAQQYLAPTRESMQPYWGPRLIGAHDATAAAFTTGASLDVPSINNPVQLDAARPRTGIIHSALNNQGGATGGGEVYEAPGLEILAHRSPKSIQFFYMRNRSVQERHAAGIFKLNGDLVTTDDIFTGWANAGGPAENSAQIWNLNYQNGPGLTTRVSYDSDVSSSAHQPLGFDYGYFYNRQPIGVERLPFYYQQRFHGGFWPHEVVNDSQAPVSSSVTKYNNFTYATSVFWSHQGRAMWGLYPLVWLDNDPLAKLQSRGIALQAELQYMYRGGSGSQSALSSIDNQLGDPPNPNLLNVGADGIGRIWGWLTCAAATGNALSPAGDPVREQCSRWLDNTIPKLTYIQVPLPGSGSLQANYSNKVGNYTQSLYGTRAAQALEVGLLINGLWAAQRAYFGSATNTIPGLFGDTLDVRTSATNVLRRLTLGLWRYFWKFRDPSGNTRPNLQGLENADYIATGEPHDNMPISPYYLDSNVPSSVTDSVPRYFEISGLDYTNNGLDERPDGTKYAAANTPPDVDVWQEYYPISGDSVLASDPTVLAPLPVPGNPADPANADYWLDNGYISNGGGAPSASSINTTDAWPWPMSLWVDPYPTSAKPSGYQPPIVGAAAGYKRVGFSGNKYPTFASNYIAIMSETARSNFFAGSERQEMLRAVRAYFRNKANNFSAPLSDVIAAEISNNNEFLMNPTSVVIAWAQEEPTAFNENNGDPLQPAWPPTTF